MGRVTGRRQARGAGGSLALALPPTLALTPDQAPRLQRLRVPARPHLKYPREWEGYDAWLGLPETPLTFPAGFGGAGADVRDE